MGATFVAAQARWEIQQWGQLLEAQALLLQPGVSTTGSPPDHGRRADAIGGSIGVKEDPTPDHKEGKRSTDTQGGKSDKKNSTSQLERIRKKWADKRKGEARDRNAKGQTDRGGPEITFPTNHLTPIPRRRSQRHQGREGDTNKQGKRGERKPTEMWR
jgi:hypothetical protein